jgi:hypothetical protein
MRSIFKQKGRGKREEPLRILCAISSRLSVLKEIVLTLENY